MSRCTLLTYNHQRSNKYHPVAAEEKYGLRRGTTEKQWERWSRTAHAEENRTALNAHISTGQRNTYLTNQTAPADPGGQPGHAPPPPKVQEGAIISFDPPKPPIDLFSPSCGGWIPLKPAAGSASAKRLEKGH